MKRVLLTIAAIVSAVSGCRCQKSPSADADAGTASTPSSDEMPRGPQIGLSLPIAAAHLDGGDVIVAGFDAAGGAIRVQRLSPKDEVVAEHAVLGNLKWSPEADIKVAAATGGVFLTWRGMRSGKLVRTLVVLGADLTPKGEPVDVTATSCMTSDAFFYSDGARVQKRTWAGRVSSVALPEDKEATLVCGQRSAWAVLDEDDRTSFLPLADDAAAAVPLFEEKEFGEDEQRERADFSAGDELGTVRLGVSGAITLREVKGGVRGPLRTLKTKIQRDDDVVAVDASPRSVVVAYTEDGTDTCEGGAPSTKVMALRVDRAGQAEETIELAPGACERERGPFFTGIMGDAVVVSWVERLHGIGKSRAPISGLSYRVLAPAGPAQPLARVDQAADGIADAGCDKRLCYAVALTRKPGASVMVPGIARVLRFQ